MICSSLCRVPFIAVLLSGVGENSHSRWSSFRGLGQNLSLADQIAMTGHALTANELSKILAVSHVTIFEQAKAGRIPSSRIGTCVRFDPMIVANWLRTQ